MTRVLIVGAGGHGQVVADILFAARRAGAPEIPVGFLDDEKLIGTQILGLPVLATVPELSDISCDSVIVAVGDNRTRRQVSLAVRDLGLPCVSAVHPRAAVAVDVVVGPGAMICAGVVVNIGSVIGDGVSLNTGCTVDHHCSIDEFAHIAPGAHLGGGVTVGAGALVGIGGVVLPGRRVGEWAVVGAGGVVVDEIPARCTAVGVPTRVIKHADRQAG